MKITESFKELNFFSILEILGFGGFVAALIYYIVQKYNGHLIVSSDALKDPFAITILSLLIVGSLGFFVSNWIEDMEW